jgi:AAA family ATP:ADP antiporter
MTSEGRQESVFGKIAGALALVEPHERRAVMIAFFFHFFLLGTWFAVRPVREVMGTVWGADQIAQLWTGTFFGTLLVAPIFGFFASRIKLGKFLPWVYGIIIASLLGFYFLFDTATHDRALAGVFYIWASVFNMLIISVFWSVMADFFSRTQSKRLFGILAAGGSVGAAIGPLMSAQLVRFVEVHDLLLIGCVGFAIAIALLVMLEKLKAEVADAQPDSQKTKLDHALGGGMLAGFKTLFGSPYLLLIACFITLITWVSTFLYVQQVDLIAQAFPSREARLQAFAYLDAVVNVSTILLQVFGTARLAKRFGVTGMLIINPIVMIFAFTAIALSPVLAVLLGVQLFRRVAEYAFTRPGREMLWSPVGQESKYKAKNVIDTVVYRGGDLSSVWLENGLRAAGMNAGMIALVGVVIAAVWGLVAVVLGRRYERIVLASPESAAKAARPATAD